MISLKKIRYTDTIVVRLTEQLPTSRSKFLQFKVSLLYPLLLSKQTNVLNFNVYIAKSGL